MQDQEQRAQTAPKPKAKPTRKKAVVTLLICLLVVALCAGGGLWLKTQHDAKVAAAAQAARIAEEQAAAQAAEQQRLAAEEAARLAAEQAQREAEEKAAAEAAAAEAARQAELEAAAAAKENVSYGTRVGTVWVEGTGVNCGLYWGDSMSIMDAGAGCSADNGCVLPGENGTVFIGAHTGSFFSDLKSTQMGAIIHLDTDWGDFQYQVTDMKVIYDTQVDLCRWGDTEPNCILYTCYPFGILTPTNQRYLVYAEPLQTDENGVVPVIAAAQPAAE